MTTIEFTKDHQGSDVCKLTDVKVVAKSPIKEGVSQRTGNPWKFAFVNVQILLGSTSMYMRLIFRNALADEAEILQPGSRISAQIDFNVTGGTYLVNEISVRNFSIIEM